MERCRTCGSRVILDGLHITSAGLNNDTGREDHYPTPAVMPFWRMWYLVASWPVRRRVRSRRFWRGQ
jgi:hypothetical protein